MIQLSDLKHMSSQLREAIDEANFKEAVERIKIPTYEADFSYTTILKQNREPAIACRMISRSHKFKKCIIDSNGTISFRETVSYDGQSIANIICDSVKINKKIPYVLTGDWSNVYVKSLYLLVSKTAVARFKVEHIEKSDTLQLDEIKAYTDPTPIIYSTYKSVAYITDCEIAEKTENFPTTHQLLGNRSGKPLIEQALKGSSPLIYVL